MIHFSLSVLKSLEVVVFFSMHNISSGNNTCLTSINADIQETCESFECSFNSLLTCMPTHLVLVTHALNQNVGRFVFLIIQSTQT